MAEESASSSTITVNIKGPSDLKLAITLDANATVEQLKQLIADENGDFPKDNQRLIFSGRVLKDEQVLASYGVKNGVAIHLVRPRQVVSLSLSLLARADPKTCRSKGRNRPRVLRRPPPREVLPKPPACRAPLAQGSKSWATPSLPS